ncbi:MAG: MFS transporter, partial [Acidimicrobiales bacterium]
MAADARPQLRRRPSGRRPPAALLAATLAMTSANGVVLPLLEDLRAALDLSDASLGLLTAVFFASSVAAQIGLARFADRGRARALLLGALAAAAASAVWFALAEHLWELLAARLLAGLSVGAFLPTVRSVVSKLDVERVGANLGALAAVELLGWTVAPAFAGALADQAGLAAPFLVLAAVAGAAAAAVARTPLGPA